MSDYADLLVHAPDKFRFVLEHADFYKDARAYNRALRDSLIARAVLCENEQDVTNIDLALIRIERMRANVDASVIRARLDEIKPPSVHDPKLDIRFRLVQAECILFGLGDMEAAKTEYESIIEETQGLDDDYLYALATNGLAVALMALGDEDASEDYFQDALSIFRRLGNQMQHAYALNNYGVLKKGICEYDQAEKYIKRALAIFRQLEVQEGLTLCYNNLGVLKFKTGCWRDAAHYYQKATAAKHELTEGMDERTAMSSQRNLLLFAEANVLRLYLARRDFNTCESRCQELDVASLKVKHSRNSVLIEEFAGEYLMELGDLKGAGGRFDKARKIALQIAPESDVMTEITRRQANLYLLQNKIDDAKQEARACIRLCKKISDKHEMGAALRVLGEIYTKQKLDKKAVAAFEHGIHVLKSIGECYELMRSCIAYSRFLIDRKNPDADIYLLDARQLCKKLELDFFMSQIELLFSRFEFNNDDYMAATHHLRRAEELADPLQECDHKQLAPQIQRFYKKLQDRILQTSMRSAGRLKELGKLYEDARFPIDELRPEMALKVAQNVGAHSLFLACKRTKGFRIPIQYNIGPSEAKAILRRRKEPAIPELFERSDPTVIPLPNDKTLVAVPGKRGYVLCTIIDSGKTFTPRELEFLFASVGAMECVAEEYSTTRVEVDGGEFIDNADTPLKHPGGPFKNILTIDPGMIKLIHLAQRASTGNVPVLLTGETGVGKELFATAIHSQSPRKDRPFIAINAGGVPINLLESQLFGHVRGAFTDAVVDRTGLVEEAEGGTLFLDEVGDMPEEMQVKLLRLLENGEYRRLGENTIRTSDVRVISATHRDLEKRIVSEEFREDLFYRLATVKLYIPALRARKHDVEFLIRHFMREGLASMGETGRRVHIDVKAMEALEHYAWPGNVREIKNEMLRNLALIGNGEVIRFGMLSRRIRDAFDNRDADGGELGVHVDRFERRLILKALEENDWNRVKTADRIGIPRTTLLFKMKRLNIVA